jgi:hypothetical protein
MAAEKVHVTFLNGYSSRKDVLGVIAIPDLPSGVAPLCRLFFCVNRQWSHFPQDFDLDGKSLTVLGPPENATWILGKHGEVIQIGRTAVNIDRIPGAGLGFQGAYGYVNTIKNIGGELYVCGYGRQVYRRRNGAWASISDAILTRQPGRGFFDIDGADPEHIYAVGWHGEIWVYDGSAWQQDDSPTNVHLNSVRCLSSENVWIAGNDGTVLHGRFGSWDVIKNDEITCHWYGIEEFNGKIYLANNGLLGVVDGNKLALLDPGLGRPVTTHKLHAKDGLLWSIGETDVLRFDGSSWQEMVHPDNVP